MRKLDRLIKEAREAAEHREHKLSRFVHYDSKTAYAECECGCWVQCETHPLPNSIEIGGSAVGVHCGDC